MSVMSTGSSVEGTKIGQPDEFDFVLCLDYWQSMCYIVPTADQNPNFACLMHNNAAEREKYAAFFNGDDRFIPYHVLHLLFRLIKRAVNDADMWENGNLSYKFENDLRHYTSKPVFHLKVYWSGLQYKSLLIGIDLVLAVRMKGWWPDGIGPNAIPLMAQEIQNEGCMLLLQTHLSDDSHLVICGMDDCISYVKDFGQNNGDAASVTSRGMLRISCALAELGLMKSFPPLVRESYALAKLVANKVCPKVIIPFRSEETGFRLANLDIEDGDAHVEPKTEITSYMLKNCVFYVLEEMGWKNQGPMCLEGLRVVQLTLKVFEHLLKCSNDTHLQAYFLPGINVFDFEMTDIQYVTELEKLGYNLIRKRRREICIKLILSILTGENLMEITNIPDIQEINSAFDH